MRAKCAGEGYAGYFNASLKEVWGFSSTYTKIYNYYLNSRYKIRLKQKCCLKDSKRLAVLKLQKSVGGSLRGYIHF